MDEDGMITIIVLGALDFLRFFLFWRVCTGVDPPKRGSTSFSNEIASFHDAWCTRGKWVKGSKKNSPPVKTVARQGFHPEICLLGVCIDEREVSTCLRLQAGATT